MVCGFVCGLFFGCGTPSVHYEGGGAVDLQGWPVRESGKRLRCPKGTALVDENLTTGGRRLACLAGDNPIPRGFAVEWHENGQLAMLFTTTDDGDPIRRTRYFSDGKKQSEESFESGRVQLRERWFESGQLQARTTYQDDGAAEVEQWQADGTLEAKGKTEGGKKVGAWYEFLDGALESRHYVAGKLDGKIERHYLDGSTELGQYRDGLADGVWSRTDPKGNAQSERTFRDGQLHGSFTMWHPNRQKRESGNYSAGKKLGVWRSYFPTGEVSEEATWRCDEKHGTWKTYFVTGQLKSDSHFVSGRSVGEWRSYSSTGEIDRVETHDPKPETLPALPKVCSETTGDGVEK